MNLNEFSGKLAVATYHHIKQNPNYHRQGEWSCGTGMCFAGWAVALAGENIQELEVEDFKDDMSGVPHAALRHLELERDDDACDYHNLFHYRNNLATIRAHLFNILKIDPEDVVPDHDLMLVGKQFVADWPGAKND